MQVLRTISEVRSWSSGKKIHFVPTMGAFHEGHLQLMREARSKNAEVIVSLFVNPMQFGANEDLEKYPRNFERDFELAKNVGVSAIFTPSIEEIYPAGFQTKVSLPELSNILCGAYRPGHFDDVATIVLKLFNIVQPQAAFFGKKDFQQLRIIETMVQDLNIPIIIRRCETFREEDGLAMSSRNVYLSPNERAQASKLDEALQMIKSEWNGGSRNIEVIIKTAREFISKFGLIQVQYLEIVNAETLKPFEDKNEKAVAMIAAYLGSTRLIDNIELN